VTALVVALIGAASGISGAAIAFRAQLRVARLTASLGEQRAESDGRRSYEYEARKRLYSAYEPLRVRMLDCTDNAVRQIVEIVYAPGPGRPGYSSAEYRLNATVYYLLAPLVIARMIERRLTLVDLGLDEGIHTEFVLAQAICRSLADEFLAAELDPLLLGRLRPDPARPALMLVIIMAAGQARTRRVSAASSRLKRSGSSKCGT
jgi:hypothetical protein